MNYSINNKPTQLLFIDATVDDIETLLQGTLPGIEAHVLSGEQDGVAQISQILQQRPEVNKVHIVSHGIPGCLYLGNTRLCLDTLHHYASQLKTWFTPSTSPSLLLYGCNVAAGDSGEEFIEKLHELTEAKIAASRQVIGNGYWSLDVNSTGTNAPAPFNEAVLATWMGRLTPSINNLSNSSYTEQGPALILDSDISFSGGTDYRGGYIEFSLGTPTSFDNLTLITDGSPSTVNGQVSILGDVVYLGNGTRAAVVGSVDQAFNGQNGQKLRINFSNNFQNGNFDLGSPGSTTIAGWTSVNSQVKFGIDTIAGLPTPTDTTIPANAPNADKNTPTTLGTMTTVLDSTQNDGSGNSVRLTSSGMTTAQGFDVVRGPYIYSNSTAYLSVGDGVSFEWQAQGGGDAYDVYGYIIDVNNGHIETILNETGNSTSASTTWAKKTITVSKAGEYRFVFVAGTFDFSGGKAAGAQLYIDDVTVTQAVPPTVLNDTHLSTIAQRVQYNNTSDNPETSKTLTVSIQNNASQTVSATATINITPVNDAPALTGTKATLAAGTEDTVYTINQTDLLVGFTDVDSNTLSVSNLTASNGTLVNNNNGTWSFTPNADYNGTVNLSYNVTDGNGGSTAATQSLTLTAVNDGAPVLTGTKATLAAGTEDTVYTINQTDLLTGFTNVDGNTLSVSNLTASNGTLMNNNNGTWSFTPTADYNGTVNLSYNVTDGNGGSTAATQTFTLAAVNDGAPAFTGTKATLAAGTEDTVYTINQTDLLAGFTDVDGDTLLVSNLTASNGTLVNNNNGTWSFTPTADYNGAVNLSYNVTDGNGGSTAATQTFTLAAVNDPATLTGTQARLAAGAQDTVYTINQTDLLAGFTDVDGDTPSVSNLTVSNGNLVNNNNGTWSFTPTTGYNGTVNLSYNVTDGNGGSTAATQSFTIAVDIDTDIDTDNDGATDDAEGKVVAEILNNNSSDSKLRDLAQKAVQGDAVAAIYGDSNGQKPIIVAINEQDQKQLGGTSQTQALVLSSVTTQRINDVVPDPIAAFDSQDPKKSSLTKLTPVSDVINFGAMPNSVISESDLQQKIKEGIKQKPVRVEIKLPDGFNDAPVNAILLRKPDGTLYDGRRLFNPNRADSDYDALTGAVLQDRNLDGKPDWAVVYLQDGEWADSDGLDNGRIENSLVAANWDLGTSRMEVRPGQDGLNFYGNRSYVQFNLDRFSGVDASEVGVARVRFGSDGQITEVNGKSVKSLLEAQQSIIESGETLFSSLTNKNPNPDIGDQTRTLAFEEGEQAVFFVIQNGTRDGLLFNGLNLNSVKFSLPALNNGVAMMTASNDERGQTAKLSFAELFEVSAKVLTAEEARPQLGLFAISQSQGQLNTTDELIDLKSSGAFDGSQVKLNLLLQREGAYNNSTYLFRVDDAKGSIRDSLTGMLLDPTSDLSAEQKQRYLELATTERLVQGTELQTPNQQTTEISVNLTGGEYYLPFLVSNGTLSTINKDFSRILTPYLGINSDSTEHIHSLGNNKFGFEDIIGGGDRDYNDMILSIKQVQIIA